MQKIRCILISDTHEQHRKLIIPEGDLLINAGDLTFKGNPDVIRDYNTWCAELIKAGIIRKSICIAGNHDWCFEKPSVRKWARGYCRDVTYLEDESCVFEGLKIWGSPWQPWFHSWAFNLHRGIDIKKKWDLIPRDTDILITHGPPYGYGDRVQDGDRVGCHDLLTAVKEIKPKLHIFGHIHESPGRWGSEALGTWYVNASSCDLRYNPVNPPIVIDINV